MRLRIYLLPITLHGIGIGPNKYMVDYGVNTLSIDLRQGTIETIELEDKFYLIIFDSGYCSYW